jgi:hypothetical protein
MTNEDVFLIILIVYERGWRQTASLEREKGKRDFDWMRDYINENGIEEKKLRLFFFLSSLMLTRPPFLRGSETRSPLCTHGP